MGYPTPLTGFARQVNHRVYTFSTPFTRFDRLPFGGRMSLIRTLNGKFILYSTVPHSKVVVDSLNELLLKQGSIKDGESFVDNISTIVIPDREHTMAVVGWYQALKDFPPTVIGFDGCSKAVDDIITCKIPKNAGYITLKGADLIKFGLPESDGIVNEGFEFIYFPHHANQELVMYDPEGVLFEADMYFNLQHSGVKNEHCDMYNEQWGGVDPQVGFWGWVCKLVFTPGWLNRWLMKGIFKDKPAAASGMQEIAKHWQFEKIIPSHGDVIERKGDKVWQEAFSFLKK